MHASDNPLQGLAPLSELVDIPTQSVVPDMGIAMAWAGVGSHLGPIAKASAWPNKPTNAQSTGIIWKSRFTAIILCFNPEIVNVLMGDLRRSL